MSKKPKFEALVVNAIRRLQAAQGSTASEIANYLSQEYDVAGPDVRRQIQLTIRRGVNYGILQKSKRGFVTCDRNIPEPLEPLDLVGDCYSCRRGIKSSRSSRRRGHGRKRRSSRRGGKRHSRRGKSRRRRKSHKSRRRVGRRAAPKKIRRVRKQPVNTRSEIKSRNKKLPSNNEEQNSPRQATNASPARGRSNSASSTPGGSGQHHET